MNCECEMCKIFGRRLSGYDCSLLHRLVLCRNAKHSSIRKLLMKTYPNVHDSRGNTPLHLAALFGADVQIVKELIDAGASVHVFNYAGSTPLHFAAGEGHRKIIEILLYYKVRGNFPDGIGETALHHAADIYNKLDLWIVKKLMEVVSKVNFRNENYQTPLLRAVAAGHLDSVRELLIYGADANICDFQSMFPLHKAFIRKETNEKIIFELIKHGSSINCTDDQERTPLYFAISEHSDSSGDNLQIAEILIKLVTLVQPMEVISFSGVTESTISSLLRYKMLCLIEVFALKSFKITEYISVHDFALRGINCSVFSHNYLIHRVYIHVLRALVARDFPIYYKIIRSHFPMLDLRKILTNVQIYANYRYDQKKVVLVSDVVFIMTDYLHFYDMIQLLRAFTIMEGIDILDL